LGDFESGHTTSKRSRFAVAIMLNKQVFAPGCAVEIYKPELTEKVLKYLNEEIGDVEKHLICCMFDPKLPAGTRIINACGGCDRRYRSLYEGISTISLWEVLAESNTFPFPDYNGLKLAIHDVCPVRTEPRVHDAVRKLLDKMNIEVMEPKNTRDKSICCGDDFYPALPVEKVKAQMKKRADEMPCEEVAVYCISCVKSMHIGGKKPRHLLDLLFGETTTIGTFEPEDWHKELQQFIDSHSS
jgi:Fe-S oxidoreductase